VDFNLDDMLELIATDTMKMYVYSAETWAPLWESAKLGIDFTGWFNQLAIADLEPDGRQEILIGSYDRLFEFRHNPQAPGNFRPQVVSVSPSNGTTVWRRQAIRLTFNEPILLETVDISCTPEVTGWVPSIAAEFSILLQHEAFPPDSSITCSVIHVEDEFGFTQVSPFSWSFLTDSNYGFDVFMPVVQR